MTLAMVAICRDGSAEHDGWIWAGADSLGTWSDGTFYSKDDQQQKVFRVGPYLCLEAGQHADSLKLWIREFQDGGWGGSGLLDTAESMRRHLQDRYASLGENRPGMEAILCGHDQRRPGAVYIHNAGGSTQFLAGDATDRGLVAIGVPGVANHYRFMLWRHQRGWSQIQSLCRFIFGATAQTQYGVDGALHSHIIKPGEHPVEQEQEPMSALFEEHRPILRSLCDSVVGPGHRFD